MREGAWRQPPSAQCGAFGKNSKWTATRPPFGPHRISLPRPPGARITHKAGIFVIVRQSAWSKNQRLAFDHLRPSRAARANALARSRATLLSTCSGRRVLGAGECSDVLSWYLGSITRMRDQGEREPEGRVHLQPAGKSNYAQINMAKGLGRRWFCSEARPRQQDGDWREGERVGRARNPIIVLASLKRCAIQ